MSNTLAIWKAIESGNVSEVSRAMNSRETLGAIVALDLVEGSQETRDKLVAKAMDYRDEMAATGKGGEQ